MRLRRRRQTVAVLLSAAILAQSAPAFAADPVEEIEYLLLSVGDSGCEFIRNGKTHTAEDAEAHLRMKYRRGKRYAKTAELFIERLATASSLTNRPYEIACDGRIEHTADWLRARLDDFRENGYAGVP